MALGPFESPILVDGVVSEERLARFLALGAEYDELDFKSTIELSSKRDEVEMAKDVGAMQVKGGYIVAGVDNSGNPTDGMEQIELSAFDPANLVPKMAKYVSGPIQLFTKVIEHQGHKIVLICVMANPRGCGFFRIDGQYRKPGAEEDTTVFRTGEVFWRTATSSVRLTQEGLEEIIERRVAARRSEWLEERAQIELGLAESAQRAREGRVRSEAPLGAVNFGLPARDIGPAALEMLRADDTIGLEHLLNDARARARAYIDADDIEPELTELLDGVACLAATFLAYSQDEWFARGVEVLVQIYAMAFEQGDAKRLGYSTQISEAEKGPRVWLAIIERVFALGALAVRREDWSAVRALTTQLPQPLVEGGYETNWLRHTLTMASRAQHFAEGGVSDKISLIDLARADAARLDCLRPDGLGSDDEAILTSIAQFDFLANVGAIDDADSTDGKVFYPNFARFRQTRIQGMADRLIGDTAMRDKLLKHGDPELATALDAIGYHAAREGMRYDGFLGWDGSPVADFITTHLPPQP